MGRVDSEASRRDALAERNGRQMARGRIAQRDYEYVRRSTANLFCIVAPKTGRQLTRSVSAER